MKSNFPEVIIFDLDDTIIEFSKGAIPSWHEACMLYYKNINTCDKDELFEAIRKAAKWYWSDPERHRIGRNDLMKARREVVVIAFNNLGLNNKDHAHSVADYYSELRGKNLTLIPEARKTLEALKNNQQRMALLTNGESSLQREKIRMFHLEQYFEKVFIEGEVGIGKPEVKAYYNLLENMHVKATDVWMVGDNLECDVHTPKSIGIFSIWNDFRQK